MAGFGEKSRIELFLRKGVRSYTGSMELRDQAGRPLTPITHYLFYLYCCGAHTSYHEVPDTLICPQCDECVGPDGWEVRGSTQKYARVRKWLVNGESRSG
jgi:hypothetical protein